MSDATTPRASRVRTWLLVGSVGLNLLVAGLAVGAFVKGPPGLRDLGFGPFDEAFRPEDRRALREAVRARAGDLRSARVQMTRDVQAVVVALRAEPFDAGALSAALAAQQANLAQRLQIGSEVIGTYMAGLSPEERLALADRIEDRARHGKGDKDGARD